MEIEINTSLQLFAEAREQPWLHASAAKLLFVPDFVAWALSGRMVSEVTIASTSQLLDPTVRGWADAVIAGLGIPRRLLVPLVEPGSVIGPVRPALAAELGLAAESEVVAVASHDTAAAVAATPLEAGGDGAFISLGTWSLLGRELAAPELGAAALRHNFTNECGAGGRIVFHKILPGLWLLQECRRRCGSAGAGLRRHPRRGAIRSVVTLCFRRGRCRFRRAVRHAGGHRALVHRTGQGAAADHRRAGAGGL
jgi:rhamnulokinase